MNDPITLDDLSAYLDDELPPGRRAAVEAALARDDGLRAALDALAWTAGVVARAPLPELPAGGTLRLPDAARGARPVGARMRPRWYAAAGLAAAVAVAAIGAGVRLGWPGDATREAAAPAADPAAMDVAEVDAELDGARGAASTAAPTAAGGDRAARSAEGINRPHDGEPRAGWRPAAVGAAVLALLAALAALAARRVRTSR